MNWNATICEIQMKCTRLLNNSETHIYLDMSFSFSSFKMWKSWHLELCSASILPSFRRIDAQSPGGSVKNMNSNLFVGYYCLCLHYWWSFSLKKSRQKKLNVKNCLLQLVSTFNVAFLVFDVIFSTFTLSWTISCLNPLFCHLYVQHHHCTLLFFLRGPHGNTSLCVAYEQPSTLWSQIPVQIQPQYHQLILPITADTTVLSQDESNNFFTLSLVWLLDKLCFTLLFG